MDEMRLTLLRRLLTWTMTTLVLVCAAVALAVIWTANERVWFVDVAGIDATLDMTLTSGGRLVLTAILGGLIVVALATLVVELASGRRVEHPEAAGASPPVTGRTFAYTPARSSGAQPQPAGSRSEPRRGRYESTIVGTADARRAEGTLPQGAGHHAGE